MPPPFGYGTAIILHFGIFSTHFATQYYAWALKAKRRKQAKKTPVSVAYCTDSYLHNFFRYPTDCTLVFTQEAFEKNKNKSQYRGGKLVKVPFFIRQQAFEIDTDKQELRTSLGFPKDKFTVVLAEGGYGIGKMQKICEILLKKDLPVTVVPVCGKNEKLFEYFKTLKPEFDSVTFIPMGFNKRMIETVAAADLFVGKAGASSIAEPTFFGVPSIVSGCASVVETNLTKHYCKTVGSTMKITNAKKIVEAIEKFVKNPDLLIPYAEKAKADRSNYGAETTADLLWNILKGDKL